MSTLSKKIIQASAGNAGVTGTYVEDVFSPYIYTGNGSSTPRTIDNNINLKDNGGAVWIKGRASTDPQCLYDSERPDSVIYPSSNTNQFGNNNLFNREVLFDKTNGFEIDGNDSSINASNQSYISWTFRKQPGFFDVLTYTGNGTTQTISHSLGSAPGMILVKDLTTGFNWMVYHRSLGGYNYYLHLNGTSSRFNNADVWQSDPTSSTFSVGDPWNNENGDQFVAYLFAHDVQDFGTNSDQSIIKCGGYTGNGSSAGQEINLGFETQFVMIKASTSSGNWYMLDTMRGFPGANTAADARSLSANITSAETNTTVGYPTSSGFIVNGGLANTNGTSYIYVAIRRPQKPASEFAATDLFHPNKFTTTGFTEYTGVGFPPDLAIQKAPADTDNWEVVDRSRGALRALNFNATNSEANFTTIFLGGFDLMDGVKMGTSSSGEFNGWNPNLHYYFRRAPGFFDIVTYTGQSAEMEIPHNLGVAPELIIQKCRTTASGFNWNSWYTGLTNSQYVNLNTTAAPASSSNLWGTNSTVVTDSIFRVGSATTGVNGGASNTHVAYLFATTPGISKVGTYTGSGSTQTIDCGFSNGARFVLIKTVSGSSNWFVWDSARGITASLDPYLILNQTAVETTNSPVDVNPASSGFEVYGNDSDTNKSNETYLFLAIA